jgi:hypothetical protein
MSGITLTLLSKPGCHLCDEMETAIAPVLAEYGARLDKRDVRDDPETRRRYQLEIPVLLLGEAELARHHVTAELLRSRLEALGLSHP